MTKARDELKEIEHFLEEMEVDHLYSSGLIRTALTRLAELERICGEAYQVLGVFSEYLPDTRILDNLAAGTLVHDDVLPFDSPRLAELEKVADEMEGVLELYAKGHVIYMNGYFYEYAGANIDLTSYQRFGVEAEKALAAYHKFKGEKK